MEKKAPVLSTNTVPTKAQPQTSTGVNAFSAIAADSKVAPKNYVKNFLAPGGGE